MGNPIQKVKYTHEAVIDCILMNPRITVNELAEQFEYSANHMSIILNSDAFQARLAIRKGEFVDPLITMSTEARLKGMVNQSLELISKRISMKPGCVTNEDAARFLEIGTKALGFGARVDKDVKVAISNVVVVPSREMTSEDWSKRYAPQTIEANG